jgi:hopanoid biosynthesis associated RND transporter like protein HpnN
MVKHHRTFTSSLLEKWVNFVNRYPFHVLGIAVILIGMVLIPTIKNFSINTDFNTLVSQDEPFRKIKKEFNDAFPQFTDTLVIVIDAHTLELSMRAHDHLANSLNMETDLFKTVYQPGGGDFFKKNGLLYKNTDELEDVVDNLADVQPFLALISEDLSLRGIFSVLQKAMDEDNDTEIREEKLSMVFDRMGKAFESVLQGRPYQLSWQEIMSDEQPSRFDLRKFIILQSHLDSRKISSLKEALSAVRRIAKELNLDKAHGVTIRITGPAALKYENLMTVRKSVGLASLVSLFLVSITLYLGLGSCRLVFASLTTLMCGLILTTGFAIAYIGHLNLISVTFAVLFIGLGIDYSIQLCLRYKELIESGLTYSDAIAASAQGVGKSLLLCSITTSIGFFAFIPTAYAGVSELGLISGTGMFINLFVNLTILPALLSVIPLKKGRSLPFSVGKTVSLLPSRYARAITVSALVLGLGTAVLIPKVFFNYNPLSLYNPGSESVSTATELFENSETSPWTASVLAKDAEEAQELEKKFSKIGEIDTVLTLAEFVPEEQQKKLDIISDMALFMPETPENMAIETLSFDEQIEALNKFQAELKLLLSSRNRGAYYSSAHYLHETIRAFKAHMEKDSVQGKRTLSLLEEGLLFNLPVLIHNLDMSLQADVFEESDLPRKLTERFVSRDGRYRVQIFPRENITDIDALERFVAAVRTVAPDATDAPVVILETGKAIVASFRQASLSALVVIAIFLLIVLRSISGTVLILIPLLLAVFLTAASSVVLGIPFNYANVIVVPLLLGIGVDNGIHFIHRFRTEPPANGNMLKTSTSRAVLFSSLTTLMSFSSLSFLAHRGTASMGKLLTICMVFLMFSTLILLPALLKLYSGRYEDNTKTQRTSH